MVPVPWVGTGKAQNDPETLIVIEKKGSTN